MGRQTIIRQNVDSFMVFINHFLTLMCSFFFAKKLDVLHGPILGFRYIGQCENSVSKIMKPY